VCRTLSALEDDETLLVQSGKPVGVFATHPEAPRVLIANANLVGRWATWAVFRELERKGLIMYGQMTAGSWIYIGTQGILQGTYETFGPVARRHWAGSLRGALGRADRELRRGPAGAGAPRLGTRRAHRPDVGARSAERLRPRGAFGRAGGDVAAARSGRLPAPIGREYRHPRARDAGPATRGRGDVRLRQ